MIYADYNGSAPMLPSVRDHLRRRLDSDIFANPNAIHSLGQKISQGMETCRGIVAKVLGAYPDQVVFNSGASEGISTVLHSVLEFSPAIQKMIVTSRIEHPAVLRALEFYRDQKGFDLKFVETDSDGRFKLASLKEILNEHHEVISLVCLMAANNETGVIQPYVEIARLVKEKNLEFFSDTTQLIGKDSFNFEASGIDYALCSGHKIGALPGSGFLILREPTKLHPLIFGSHQEKGMRGGTQNYLGIETLAVALEDFTTHLQNLEDLKFAREKFEKEIQKNFPKTEIIGKNSQRLPGTTLIGYPGLHGQAIQIELESQDIFVTTSAACSDNEPETSEVLRAMKISDDLGRSVVRISLSYSHGEKEYALLAQGLKNAYNKLIKIQSY